MKRRKTAPQLNRTETLKPGNKNAHVILFTHRRAKMKKCEIVSVFIQPDVNTREIGRTRHKQLIECFPNLASVYIKLCKHRIVVHFFYKITKERGTKTVFTCAHVKWFSGQSERAYYLNYFMIKILFIVAQQDLYRARTHAML